MNELRFSVSGQPFILSISAPGLDPQDSRYERISDQLMTFLHEHGYQALHVEEDEDVELRHFEFGAAVANLRESGYPIPISVLRRTAYLASDDEIDRLNGASLAPEIKVWARREILLPSRAHPGDSGLDLRADLTKRGDFNGDASFAYESDTPGVIELRPGASVVVPTGVHFAVPIGYEIQIRPRSGLARNNCITVLNSPGTIDWSYRGEVGIILINHGDEEFHIEDCMKIAQAVVCPVVTVNPEAVKSKSDLGETSRGNRGYGSTGL